MRRKQFPEISKLYSVEADLIEYDIYVDHGDSGLECGFVRVGGQRGCARVGGVEGAFDDQTGHAAGDTESDELVAWEAVDEKQGEDAAAEGEGDPAALVEKLGVCVEAQAGVEGGAVVVDDKDTAELNGAGCGDADEGAFAVAGFREHGDVAGGQAGVDLHLFLDLDEFDSGFFGGMQLV